MHRFAEERFWLWIVGGLVVGMLLFPGAAAAAKRPSCELPRSKTYVANQTVRVFTTRDGVLRGCPWRRPRPFALARQGPVGGGVSGFANVELSGRHVALTARACDRGGTMCRGEVRVWDVRTRRLVRRIDGTWASDLELHPNGSVAWITAPLPGVPPTEPAVRVNDRAGERTLASGAVAADSLALGGSMLYWTQDGAPHASAFQ